MKSEYPSFYSNNLLFYFVLNFVSEPMIYSMLIMSWNCAHKLLNWNIIRKYYFYEN